METDVSYDRPALVAALWAAVRGSDPDRARLCTVAERMGANRAAADQSLGSVIAELDALEAFVLSKLGDTADSSTAVDARRILDGVQLIHQLCAGMRRHAVTGYGRSARHDVVNAVGAARNAILLLEEGAAGDARQRFRDITQRNLRTAEHLVRIHLADGKPDRADSAGAAPSSPRDQGDDLGCPRETDHLDTLGQ